MIGCLRTRVRKQLIIALYFEFENKLKFYNLEAWLMPGLIWGFAGRTVRFDGGLCTGSSISLR